MTTVDLEQQRLLIGGEWVEASGGGTFERTDPFTGEAVDYFDVHDYIDLCKEHYEKNGLGADMIDALLR